MDKTTTAMIAAVCLCMVELALIGAVPAVLGAVGLLLTGFIIHNLLHHAP